MRGSRRRTIHRSEIWPAYVDAFSSLVMVIVLILVLLIAAQFLLSDALTKQNSAYDSISQKLNALNRALRDETKEKNEVKLELSQTQDELGKKRIAIAEKEAESKRLGERIGNLESQLTSANETIGSEASKRGDLNRKIDELLNQLQALNGALGAAHAETEAKQIEISSLTERLNRAMAEKVEELAQYRSEFFGKLKKTIGERSDIRVVGDRFVFQSEVLFSSASAILEEAGNQQLGKFAKDLLEISKTIPEDLNWVLEVQGHTDKRPIRSPLYPSNWELSQARALSVVKFLIEHGIPPHRLSASGNAEFQPLDPTDSESSYRKNRRIELKLSQIAGTKFLER